MRNVCQMPLTLLMGAVPERIRCQSLEAITKEPLQLKKVFWGKENRVFGMVFQKQTVGHDVSASDVNDACASVRPSIVVGERGTSQGVPMNVQAQAAFNKVSGLKTSVVVGISGQTLIIWKNVKIPAQR